MKRYLAALLSLIMCISLCIPTMAAASAEKNKKMDTLDIVIAAYMCAGGIEESRSTRDEIIHVVNIEPLYDMNGEVSAYYVVFSSNCYAVVANNIDNPAVLEFGEGRNAAIERLLGESKNPKLVYNNPQSIYCEDYLKTIPADKASKMLSIHESYPDLSEKNSALSSCVAEAKKTIQREGTFTQSRGDGDYGFFYANQMPTGRYTSDIILSASSVDWAIMSDYNDIAKNHCGATTVTNLALYFEARGKQNLKINNSKRDTFIAVHDIVGNGPVMTIASSAVTYFANRGYRLVHSSVGDTQSMKTAIDNNRPCGVLLADGLFAWHWIISVGWRQYTSSGDFYMRINNNWDNSIDVYYKVNSGSAWWSATSYDVVNWW